MASSTVIIEASHFTRLEGDLDVPQGASGIIIFAHGSGSSRLSPRNRMVADHLREGGRFGTLLFDLLTPEEDTVRRMRFDIGLLAERLSGATEWLKRQELGSATGIGYFGASTGAAAALVAASQRTDIAAIVSRGGRPDLAGTALYDVTAPTLLIVGGEDGQVIQLNRWALANLASPEKAMQIVAGATHLFEEPGALEEVARLSRDWFERHVGPGTGRATGMAAA